MPRKNAKMSDETLSSVFSQVAMLYTYLKPRQSDYAVQEAVTTAVEARIQANPVFRSASVVNKLADLLTIDDKATPVTKLSALHAMGKAAAAPDASNKTIWFAVYSMREASLTMPEYSKEAEKAIWKIAKAHPESWQEPYESAGAGWNGMMKNKLEQELSLDIMRRQVSRQLSSRSKTKKP